MTDDSTSQDTPHAAPGTPRRRHEILVIPGDGIGKEVVPVALNVLDLVAERHGFEVACEVVDWGCERYVETGSLAPEGWLDRCGRSDAILLGAVGYPGVPDHVSLWGLLIPIRQAFDQYVNLRPARTLPGVPSALAGDQAIDVAIVRENTEGEYTRLGGIMFEGTEREFVLQESVFTRRGIERVVAYACDLATQRGGSLVAATKSNGLVHSMPYWDSVAREVAEARGLDLQLQHVDALAARFVSAPESLDVVVASNLFGDILSDLAAAVAGGLGLAASANLAAEGAGPSMFEPVHGSAPDIAGTGTANPAAQVLSVAMMLDHLGESMAAAAVRRAVHATFENEEGRTADLGGQATTASVSSLIRDEIMQRAT